MEKKKTWHFLLVAAMVALISLACGASDLSGGGGGEPPAEAVSTSIAPPVEPEPPSLEPAPTATAAAALPSSQPAILETRRLTLEWPPTIRAGDGDIVRLTLEVDDQGRLTPTAETEGHQVTGQTVEIPDLFATHNVMAEARLDLAGVDVNPPGMSYETLRPGQSVTFYWSIRPEEVGVYRGTVWFFLRFIPQDGGLESETALAALPVDVEAVSFLGLHAGPARWLGAVGSFVGGVLGIPFFEDILRFVFKRKPRRA